MPLLKGNDKNIIGENIREMKKAGHPEAQAVAAAMRMAKGKPKKKMPVLGTKKPTLGDEEDGESGC